MSDEIKFCKYCGRKIAANAKFCSYCGGEQGAFISQDNSNQKTDSTGVFSKKPETAAGEHISETTTDLD
ncbi:MAG: zinc ribbon domain-containing protein, partial [Erysipelotrichia bacterium]|nr:zinc ribbon domain-containing protein [Erysipelotrichia bacterium]